MPLRWALAKLSRLFGTKRGRRVPGLLTLVAVGILLCVATLVFISSDNFLNDGTVLPTDPPATPDHENKTHPSNTGRYKVDRKVLVVIDNHYSKQGGHLVHMLEAFRIKVKTHSGSKNLPTLIHKRKGKFALVVFEKLETYLNLDEWNRDLLDKYLREYDVGMIVFTHPEVVLFNARARGFPLHVHTQLQLRDFEVTAQTPIPRISKSNIVIKGQLPGTDWTVFVPSHQTYVPLAQAKLFHQNSQPEIQQTEHKHIAAIYDQGLFDGIRRVLFGNSLLFWLNRVLFVDAVHFLTHGNISIGLERYILVDIDDVFVSKEGSRMTAADVEALLEAQKYLRQRVPGFTFNLGFSGGFFQKAGESENQGDQRLIDLRDHFWWFGHMWTHQQAHKLSLDELLEETGQNKEFAKAKGLNINTSYAIAPHHSGVFPVHEELYQAWAQVWGVKVTSTEEYPHLRHAPQRRGFAYRGIQVLPRQTCGLFTHTTRFENDQIPDFRHKLDASICGGELFMTFLYTPVLIFMTHLPNYGQDRLGVYTFSTAVNFIQRFTNLQLYARPPEQLANIYFSLYPQDAAPLWRNPCDDKRHLEIWSNNKDCHRLPDFLVIGPQKTGTTALHTFLTMHPAILNNYNSPVSYEEVQFFNGDNYLNGLDWYLQYFPKRESNRSWPLIFEKSANYFDSSLAPRRAAALLPKAKLIVILIDPALRAYSWYQHQLAHRHPVAMTHTFEDILSSGREGSKGAYDLRSRCLYPGLYIQHLQAWLEYYPSRQLLIIDGDDLKDDPVTVMDKVQTFLDVSSYMDYTFKLRYSKRKGFYCAVTDGGSRVKCLGGGKGRKYQPMTDEATRYLTGYYRKANIMLAKLLEKLGVPAPQWLQRQLEQENS